MKPLLFSIIIPVYNVERYIDNCIQSIISQTFHNYELLLIDDGSTDNSYQCCCRYSKENKQIKVFHTENRGASAARNFGIDQASGQYILFIDSDDFLKNIHALELIEQRISEYEEDTILYGCIDKDLATGKETISRKYDLSQINNQPKEHILKYLYESGNFPGAAWIMCTKLSLINEKAIRFPINMTAEDYYWISCILHFSNKIGAINMPLYVYHKNRINSITSHPRLSGIKGICHAIAHWLLYKNEGETYITNFLCRTFIIALYNYSNLSSVQKKECRHEIKSAKKILTKSSLFSFKLLFLLINIGGISITARCIRFLVKVSS